MKLATLCYIIDRKNSKTLMIHRVKKKDDYHEGKWNGLGGKFNKGETPEECAVREVFEESGLKIKNPSMRGFITFPLFDGTDDWYVFLFTADNYEGEIINSSEGNLEWIPNDKLTSLNLWDGDKIFLEWLSRDNTARHSRFFSAKFIYEGGIFKDYKVCFY
ncbi:MAG TPA: 8-oxo-dGTP diphosphatase [Ignavibacteriaceae bacterium]|jgi:8-oxo-dGTP diphosphatase